MGAVPELGVEQGVHLLPEATYVKDRRHHEVRAEKRVVRQGDLGLVGAKDQGLRHGGEFQVRKVSDMVGVGLPGLEGFVDTGLVKG